MPLELAYEIAALWGQTLPEGRFLSGPNERQSKSEMSALRPPLHSTTMLKGTDRFQPARDIRVENSAGTQLNPDPDGSPRPVREALGVAASRAPRALLIGADAQGDTGRRDGRV